MGSSAATSSSSPTPTHTPACCWRGGSRDPAPRLLLAMIVTIIVSWLARRDLRPFLSFQGKCWGARDLEAAVQAWSSYLVKRWSFSCSFLSSVGNDWQIHFFV